MRAKFEMLIGRVLFDANHVTSSLTAPHRSRLVGTCDEDPQLRRKVPRADRHECLALPARLWTGSAAGARDDRELSLAVHVWHVMKRCLYLVTGLCRAGFANGWLFAT